jgi:hypothetical protein
MKIQRHKATKGFLGIVTKEAFPALHLSQGDRNILAAAAKLAGEAREKIEDVEGEGSLLSVEFGGIECRALDLLDLEYMELEYNVTGTLGK